MQVRLHEQLVMFPPELTQETYFESIDSSRVSARIDVELPA